MLELNMMTKKAVTVSDNVFVSASVLIYTCTTRRMRVVMYDSVHN